MPIKIFEEEMSTLKLNLNIRWHLISVKLARVLEAWLLLALGLSLLEAIIVAILFSCLILNYKIIPFIVV